MKQSTIELRKLTADEGMTLTNGEVFGKEIYLGVNDYPNNWYEITDEEYSEIEKANAQEEMEKGPMEIVEGWEEKDYIGIKLEELNAMIT